MLNCCLSLSFPFLLDSLTVTHTVICHNLGTHCLHRGQKCGFIRLKMICEDWTYFFKSFDYSCALVFTAVRASTVAISYEHHLWEMEDHSQEGVQPAQHLSTDGPTSCAPAGSQTDRYTYALAVSNINKARANKCPSIHTTAKSFCFHLNALCLFYGYNLLPFNTEGSKR